tara:strand:+ start:1209 stop:2822 length:1614 start_codon:yes stop_codon:yes gene_type:complete
MSKEQYENITSLPCPYVDCGSSNAFSYNTKGFGLCFSCKTNYPSSNPKFDWVEKEYPPLGSVKTEDDDIFAVAPIPIKEVVKDRGSWEYKSMRGISERTMETYNVKTYKKGATQEYVYPSGGIKTRDLKDKDFFVSPGFKTEELFGMNFFTAGCSKTLTITEGELDALSAYQMLNNRDGYLSPVVSLPSASPSKAIWEICKPYLDSFDRLVLSVDNDKAGNEIADKICKMFPAKVFRVAHNKFKDANDFLLGGAAKEFVNAWFNASKYVPDNVLNTTEQFLDLFENSPTHNYVPTGIKALDEKILGLMQGHFTVIKAPTGIGKTEVMRLLEYNMLKRGIPIATWHLEETKLRSLLGLVSYEADLNLTRRDLIDDEDATDLVKETITSLTKDGLLYQFFLQDGQGVNELCEQIRYFSQACECKYVFFEPIQDVVVGSSADSKESMLADLSIRLSKLAAELDVGIVTIAHTNEDGDPKYCKMIAQRASVLIDLSRDKEADTLIERNTTSIVVQKNRPASVEGAAGSLRFSTDTFKLREV